MKRVNKRRHQGYLLVGVMVCLAIASTIALLSIQSSLRSRRQLRQEECVEQARWLLDAGVNRAAAQLMRSPEYQGEIWKVTPELSSCPDATVVITVNESANADSLRSITVSAHIGTLKANTNPTVDSIKRSRNLQLDLEKLKQSNS